MNKIIRYDISDQNFVVLVTQRFDKQKVIILIKGSFTTRTIKTTINYTTISPHYNCNDNDTDKQHHLNDFQIDFSQLMNAKNIDWTLKSI